MQLLLTRWLWQVIVQMKLRLSRAAQCESWGIMTKTAHVNHSIFHRLNCCKQLLVRSGSGPSTATTRPSTWRKNDAVQVTRQQKLQCFYKWQKRKQIRKTAMYLAKAVRSRRYTTILTDPRAIDATLPVNPMTLTGTWRLVVELSPSCTKRIVNSQETAERTNRNSEQKPPKDN